MGQKMEQWNLYNTGNSSQQMDSAVATTYGTTYGQLSSPETTGQQVMRGGPMIKNENSFPGYSYQVGRNNTHHSPITILLKVFQFF